MHVILFRTIVPIDFLPLLEHLGMYALSFSSRSTLIEARAFLFMEVL